MTTPRVTVPVEPIQRLILAADSYGVRYLDSDDMSAEAEELQDATEAMKDLIAAPAPEGGAVTWRIGDRVSLHSGGRGTIVNVRYGLAMDLKDGSPDLGWAPKDFLDTDPEDFIIATPAEAGELKADFTRSHPSGMDDATYSQIEDALDRADAPIIGPDRKFLTLAQRVDALRAQPPAREDAQPVAWRPVVGFEGHYEVSALGDVRNVKTGRTQAKNTMGRGYIKAEFWKDGERTQTSVHRVVAEAFLPRRDGLNEVNHIDGDKTNNAAWNLEWTDRKGNTDHSRHVLGNDVKPVLATDPETGAQEYFPSIEEAGRSGYNASGIYDALNGRKHTHGGKAWSFTEWRGPQPIHPAPDALRVAVEALSDLIENAVAARGCGLKNDPDGIVSSALFDTIMNGRQALAALQAEQKGGAK